MLQSLTILAEVNPISAEGSSELVTTQAESAQQQAELSSAAIPSPPAPPVVPPPPPAVAAASLVEGPPAGIAWGVLSGAPSWLVSMVVHLALFVALALVIPTRHARQGFQDAFAVTSEDGDGSSLDGSMLNALSSADALDAPIDAPPLADIVPAITTAAPAPGAAAAPDVVALAPGALTQDPLGVGRGSLGEDGGGLEVVGAAGLGTELGGRFGAAARRKLAMNYGASTESLAAVELALKWLAEHQETDGSWRFDHDQCPTCRGQCRNPGMSSRGRIAATSLALLPFLGNGQTHRTGIYRRTVDAGLHYLMRAEKVRKGAGSLDYDGGEMYGQGLASIVLCEAYVMTNDSALRQPAQSAIQYIVEAQDRRGGGWRYRPSQQGDTSVVGWQLMALKSAHLAKLRVPQNTIHSVEYFLDSVQSEEGARYGYLGPGGRPATSAIGLLCRMYLGWPHEHRPLVRGVGHLTEMGPSTDKSVNATNDMYYNYYATQVMHHYGGYPWEEWNRVMRDYLVATQDTVGHQRGSWFFAGTDLGGSEGGRLYFTAMAAMTLEVYYRHLPLYRDEARTSNFFKP